MCLRRIVLHLVTALGVAILATILGGVAHALVIVPVWSQLGTALPFAALVGVAMSWAVTEATTSQTSPRPVLRGFRVGVELWAALLPMTAFEGILRVSNLHDGSSWLQAIAQVVIAFSSGFAIGWLASRDSRSGLAMGVATVALALALGGAVPVTSSVRSLVFFVSLLPVTAITGACIGGFHRECGLGQGDA